MHEASFHAIDAAVLVLLLYSLLVGLVRGLAGELARAVAFLGLLAAVYFLREPVAVWLEAATRIERADAPVAALALLATLALAAFLIGRAVIQRVFKRRFRGLVERIGGAAAGLIRGLLLAAALLLAVAMLPFEPLQCAVTETSFFGRTTHATFPEVKAWVSERFDLPSNEPDDGALEASPSIKNRGGDVSP